MATPTHRDAARRALCALALVLAAAVVINAAPALAASGIRVEVGTPGATEVQTTGARSGLTISRSRQINDGAWNGTASAYGLSTGEGGVRVSISGNRAALAKSTLDNREAAYRLKPPAGVNFAGGRLVVIARLPDGEITGNASLRMRLDVAASRLAWPDHPTGFDEVTLTPAPGADVGGLRAEVQLPGYLDSTQFVDVSMGLLLDAAASVTPSGGAIDVAGVDAHAGARITGFQVLDAAGGALSGFTLTGSGTIPEIAPPPPGIGRVVEFYIAAFGHYFISANPAEVAALDNNPAWARTGESFAVNTTPGSGLAGVCRFFREFPQPSGPAKSSHFYALQGLGCDELRANPQGWLFEGVVFYLAPPDTTGACPANTVPVFRLYNNGMSGASNHRYTTSEKIRNEMLRDGYVSEGAGVLGVGMCAPATGG
jgi:hypothetical protein